MSKVTGNKNLAINSANKSKAIGKTLTSPIPLNERGLYEVPKQGATSKQNEDLIGIVGQLNENVSSKVTNEDILQKEEEILSKQNIILNKLEEVMNKISPEPKRDSTNQNTEDSSELRKENKRLNDEVESLKKKLNSLNIYDKKLGSVGFIFKEEARECVDCMKKLDPNFSTDCDLTSSDSTNLENQISLFFNDVKVALNNLSSNKEENQEPQRDNEKNISVNDVSINNKNSLVDLSKSKDKYTSSPNRKLIPKDNANAELLIELNMLRRKVLDYEIIQDELNYYKNLSLNYHKNSNLLHNNSLQNLNPNNDTQYTNPYRNSSSDFRTTRLTNNYNSTYRSNAYNTDMQFRKYY